MLQLVSHSGILTNVAREVSHPNLIDIEPIQAKGYPDCANIA